MNVPQPLEITASLMAGYRFLDGSLIEVDDGGDYRITDKDGTVLDETISTGNGLRFGIPPADYGEIMDDMAAFLTADGEYFYYGDETSVLDHDELIFNEQVARWAGRNYDELSILACYREDKRLGEEE